jgi:4-hydroxy-4-methyl-2-oxoglutarate aldolase
MSEAIPDHLQNVKEFLERFSRFDEATLFEAAGQRGMVDPGIRPAWPGAKVCGIAVTVVCPPGDNLMLHRAVALSSAGSVIVADAGGYLRAGAWGEILTVAAQSRGVRGLVIDGAARDMEAIAALGFPVFSRGLAIGACTKKQKGTFNHTMIFGGQVVRPGDVVVGGADGVVVIDQDRAEAVYNAAVERQNRELAIMRELREGKTTLELLGLSRYFDPGNSNES